MPISSEGNGAATLLYFSSPGCCLENGETTQSFVEHSVHFAEPLPLVSVRAQVVAQLYKPAGGCQLASSPPSSQTLSVC